MGSRFYQASLTLALVITPLARGSAQRLTPTWESRSLRPAVVPAALSQEPSGNTSFGRLIGGGILGGLAAVGIGQIAYQLSGGGKLCGDDPCGLWAGVITTVVLEPVLIPVGVHLANHRRGTAGLSFLASTGVGVGGLLVANAFDGSTPIVVLTPVAQLLATALVERATSH